MLKSAFLVAFLLRACDLVLNMLLLEIVLMIIAS